MNDTELEKLVICRQQGMTWQQISAIFPEHTPNALRKTYYRQMRKEIAPENTPKILLLDLETAPILGYVWQLFDQNVALNQIHSDWYILSWSAKWLGSSESEVMYADQRNAKNIEDDSVILRDLWKLVDEASIIITQNGKKFDEKKMNARFILNGFKPTSSFRHVDTLQLAKARFGFTSNKLEYMTGKLCTKYKKLDHDDFSGFKLWSECLKGNIKAFDSMKKYNMYDVLSLEELYLKLRPWDKKSPNLNVYNEYSEENFCDCGSVEFKKNGFIYSNTGKFQRYTCLKCGAETRSKTNLLSKEKRKSLRSN
jgi:hypothetical protein